MIVNTRNFGHVRSPYHGLLQARGDAVCCIAADLQDPPELIREFVAKWEEGYKVVVGVKNQSLESVRCSSCAVSTTGSSTALSEVPLIANFTGYGLYDRVVIDALREIDDPYPYFRGLVSDLGYEHVEIPYVQQRRERGVTKNNFYTLYDLAMLGITNHSKVPLRLAMMAGFLLSVLALGVSLIYLVLKLMFWQTFDLGLAPLLIGIYFFGSAQLFFIGILGEYIGRSTRRSTTGRTSSRRSVSISTRPRSSAVNERPEPPGERLHRPARASTLRGGGALRRRRFWPRPRWPSPSWPWPSPGGACSWAST